jgi:hypothetical protein
MQVLIRLGTPVANELTGRSEVELSDAVSDSFFAEGLRQEAQGMWREPSRLAYRGSFDRLPRHFWPTVVFLVVVVGSVVAAAGLLSAF